MPRLKTALTTAFLLTPTAPAAGLLEDADSGAGALVVVNVQVTAVPSFVPSVAATLPSMRAVYVVPEARADAGWSVAFEVALSQATGGRDASARAGERERARRHGGGIDQAREGRGHG